MPELAYVCEGQQVEDLAGIARAPVECCQHCGQRQRRLNPHRMDRSKVELLRKIDQKERAGHRWIKLQRDGRLIPADELPFTIQCDDVHGMRMAWFGLLERRAAREGFYRLSEAGRAFLNGALDIPAAFLCRNGRVEYYSAARVNIRNVQGVVLNKEYWDGYPSTEAISA